MGKRKPALVVVSSSSSSENDESRCNSVSWSRSRSVAPVSGRKRSRGGSSAKARDGLSRARSSHQIEQAANFDMLSEDLLDCLRDFRKAPGLKCSNMQEIWIDKYKPRSEVELAVHRKKVEEVKKWLQEKVMKLEDLTEEGFGNFALLITGQAGVGKSAAVHVIASQLGAQLCEWTTPTPTIWQEHVHNSISGIRYLSKLDEFEIFVEKISKYCLLRPTNSGGSGKPAIVLIDDLPVTNGRIAFARLKKCLTTLVRSTHVPTVILITEYHKTESVDSSTQNWEELGSSLERAGAHKVTFNPLTVNSIKKSLSRICQEEKCDVSVEWIDWIARASGGDIRHAVTSLQYLCLRPEDCFSFPVSTQIVIHSEANVQKSSSQSSPGDGDLNSRTSLSFGRDETLNLFHALGKFLHNKREKVDAFNLEQDSFILQEKLTRNPLKMDSPENVLSLAHGQPRHIADFLHENVLDFISDEAIDDAWLVTSYLCDADFLLASALRPTWPCMMSEIYEPRSITQSVAASVAVRGVLFGNLHPSPSRWHTIRSPRIWQVEQSLRLRKNQIKLERFEAHDDYSLCRASQIPFEYGSTVKWLRSQTSCIHHQAHEECLHFNTKEDDTDDWVNPNNLRGNSYSEESEEDVIEDW